MSLKRAPPPPTPSYTIEAIASTVATQVATEDLRRGLWIIRKSLEDVLVSPAVVMRSLPCAKPLKSISCAQYHELAFFENLHRSILFVDYLSQICRKLIIT